MSIHDRPAKATPRPSTMAESFDAEASAERTREDRIELAMLEASEQGRTFTLAEELAMWAASTAILPLQRRRLLACCARRDAECTVGFVLDHPDALGELVWAYLAGLDFDADAGRLLPSTTRKPARPTVTLRRVDRGPDGYSKFCYKASPRSLNAVEAKRAVREWATAGYPGLDPTAHWVEVVPRADGCFELPLLEARKVLAAYRDNVRRQRRRNQGAADRDPIIAEGATSAYVPVAATPAQVAP